MTTNHRSQTSLRSRRPGKKSGQTLVEYALILAFISVVAIASLLSMGSSVTGVYSTVDRQMASSEQGGAAAATHH